MQGIGDFFKRIKDVHAREITARVIIQDALKKCAPALIIPLESISFSSSVVVLKNIPQAARSEIFIKKQKIIEEINTRQSSRVITDIK